MFAAKNHEPSKTKAEKTPAQVNAKAETAERVQVNPLWNLLATGVQAKLTVSAPDDPYEREADRVADQIMRMPQPAVQRACPTCAAGGPPCPKCQQEKVFAIHRKADGSGDIADASVPEGFLSNLGPGRPPDASTWTFMQPRFGHDFGQVRVHTDAPQSLQTSLTVNQPGDEYEQEADRVAEQVMRMPEPRVQRQAAPEEEEEEELLQTKPLLQRQRELEGEEEDEELLQTKPLLQRRVNDGIGTPAKTPAIVHDVTHSPGQPLDPATRAFMEPRFGHDFNQVRVHTDDEAAESARAVDARAFTVGQDVVFGTGQYAKTSEGVRLLAHELTHVVQQGGHYIGKAGFIQRQDGNVGGGNAAETLSTCDQPSGIDTITFAPHLVTDVRTVQLYYRKEEPPGGKIQIPYAELSGNLFTEEPLHTIVAEQSCGDWIRFDITDKPPGWQGPSLENDSITIWGLAPPRPDGTRKSNLSRESELHFVADQFLFDLIIRQRQFTRKDDEEAFDLRVIDEFFRGIGEGLGAYPYKKGNDEGLVQDLSQNWNTLFQIYAKHAVFFPILQYNLWLGAMDGIAEEGADTLVSLTQFAEDPQAFIDQVMEAIRLGIMQPQSTARQFGRAIGADLKQQLEKLITPKNQEDPSEFLYELGKIVGPVLLNVILTVLAPEAYILRGVAKAGGLLLHFVDDVFDLGKIGTIHWKPSIAKNLDVPGALTRVGEILRSGGIRLKSGHEIRIIDNMLERCSSCSILARVYSPVLDSQLPEANDLRNQVAELQREVDEFLAVGTRKEDLLATHRDKIAEFAEEVEKLARANDIEFDRLTEETVLALEALFADNTGAINSLAALGQGAANTLLGLPEPTRYLFRKIWQRPSKEYRDAAARILTDSRLTNQNQITKALEQVHKASDQSLRGEPALVRMISRSLVPNLRGEWTNPAFKPTTAPLSSSQGWIDPRQLLYGQGGAESVFQKKVDDIPIPIQSMADLLSDEGKSWQDVHKELGLVGTDTRHSVEITQLVVGPEEIYLFTLDHRRIICAQAAYNARGGLLVPYTVVAPDLTKMDFLGKLFVENPSKEEIRKIFRNTPELGKSIQIR